MAGLFDSLTSLPAPLVCALVFVLAMLETAAFAGLAVPGETAVVLGGVVAFQGRIPVAAMAAAASLGAVVGDSVGFYLGRRLGTKVLGGRVGRLVGRARVESTMTRIRAGGIRAVVLGRFVGVLRAVMPFAAGASGMAYGRFLVASVLGATAWGTGFTLVGYLAGNSWRRVERYVGRASTVLAVVIVTVVVLVLLARATVRRQDRIRAAWRAFLDRPRVAAVRRRYARQLAFVGKRFRPGPAAGLQLTAVLVGLAILGWLLAVILVQVLGRTGLPALDRNVRSALADQPARLADAVAAVHAVLSPAGAVALAALVGLVTWWRDRRPRGLVVLAVTVAGGLVVPPVVRALVARPNPFTGSFADRTFPATATTVAAATAIALLVVLLPRAARWTRMVTWTFVAIGVVIGAGFAELLAGDVFLSDVLGGAVLGALWGLAASFVVTAVWRAPRPGTS
ncbi:MAG TPA: VTT domain-containing protein [Mycobacteriales bacterium]|jgi:undecaprenyl-diphosphatase|nr:VTT domain-containing protein [Mycobacteriales bacterium]